MPIAEIKIYETRVHLIIMKWFAGSVCVCVEKSIKELNQMNPTRAKVCKCKNNCTDQQEFVIFL